MAAGGFHGCLAVLGYLFIFKSGVLTSCWKLLCLRVNLGLHLEGLGFIASLQNPNVGIFKSSLLYSSDFQQENLLFPCLEGDQSSLPH